MRINNHLRIIRYPSRLPKNLLILLTNPRSGSTWLFDALRCHPGIHFQPRATLNKFLNLSCRRYPIGLSNSIDSSLKVEVRPDQWERIPDFSIRNGDNLVPEDLLSSPYAIEKFHPHHFGHNIKDFLTKIEKLEKKIKVKFVYQIRDPKSSVLSFLSYQKRNPNWNAKVSRQQLPGHMLRIYHSIHETAKKRNGLIIDYSELVNNFHTTMEKIFKYLWPEHDATSNGTLKKLTGLTELLTNREIRKVTGKDFFGDKAGPIKGSNGHYDKFFHNHSHEISRCYHIYNALIKLAPQICKDPSE
jgi:hypothetical protein